VTKIIAFANPHTPKPTKIIHSLLGMCKYSDGPVKKSPIDKRSKPAAAIYFLWIYLHNLPMKGDPTPAARAHKAKDKPALPLFIGGLWWSTISFERVGIVQLIHIIEPNTVNSVNRAFLFLINVPKVTGSSLDLSNDAFLSLT